MRATIFQCLVVLLFLSTILSMDGVSSSRSPPNDGFAVNNQATIKNPKALQLTHTSESNELKKEIMKKKTGLVVLEKAEKLKEVEKIGSRPPRCEDKCYGCMPCEAIQVPTTSSSSSSRVGVQYTNYEPEGWKCKCGPTFYTP